MNTDNSVYVAASTFEDKGGWTADPQFMEQMGSSYLIAHGLGQPVDDARTHFTVPQDGTYNLFPQLDRLLVGPALAGRVPHPDRRPGYGDAFRRRSG